MRTAAKIDANHREIVARFIKHGALVRSLADVGRGMPDLLVQFRARCPSCRRPEPTLFLVEVKDGSKPPSRRRLTPDQEKMRSLGWVFAIVTSVEDVDELLLNR